MNGGAMLIGQITDLHIKATGVVSHTAFVGEFAGPYPFYAGGKLID